MRRTSAEYVDFLRETCWYAHAHEQNAQELTYLVLGLAGEAGETVEVIKKIVREAGFNLTAEQLKDFMVFEGYRSKLIDELGDVLWYLVRLSDVLGVSLSDLIFGNTYKLFRRIEQENWAPPMIVEWPFTDPLCSYENVQMNLFPQDQPDDEEYEDVY